MTKQVLDDCDRHIIVQLRKSIDLRGNFEVVFENGDKKMIDIFEANKALDVYQYTTDTTIGKDLISHKLAKSLSDFYEVIGI